MFRLFKYIKKENIPAIIICMSLIVVQVWLDLKLPDYMSEITQLVQMSGSQLSEILHAGGYMLACALGSMLTSIVVGYFAARIAAGLSKELREKVFEKTMDFSMAEINNFSTSSLITRCTNDINQVQMLIAMGLQVMVKAPIMAVWAILKILGKSWQWSAVTAVALVIMLSLILVMITLVMPKFKIIQKLTDNLNRVTRENITGVRVVRAYNAENYQEEKFANANEDITRTNLYTQKIMAFLSPSISMIQSCLTLGIYVVGVFLIDAAFGMDRISLFSDMVVFSSYAMQVIMSFMMLAMIFVILPRASVSAARINEVLDSSSSIVDGTISTHDENIQGVVEFKNVGFEYPDAEEYVLKDVSFKAEKGETIAFIGSTGSGKSTLINLIPRFYDASEGEILVDGINIKDYTLECLHDKIGYVPQKAVMFSGSIESNVSYGESGEVEKEYVKEAVRIAQGKDFVENLEEKYEGHVAQGGPNFSGGQKQRLAIARAIYRRPEFYIFDDSFSALDYKTDRILRSELKKATKGVTTFIVAARIGTILDADKIIVLEEGNVVGIGTHKQLLENCSVYQEIAHSQLSKEELSHA